jgi:hypothetical protein
VDCFLDTLSEMSVKFMSKDYWQVSTFMLQIVNGTITAAYSIQLAAKYFATA